MAGLLDTVNEAFGRLRDGLLQDTAMDVSAEIAAMEAVMALAAAHRGKILFSAGSKPYLTVRPEKGKNGLETARWALEQIGQALEQAAKEHPQQEMQAQEKQTAVQKPQE